MADRGLRPERGDGCNRVKIGGTTELFGDPAKKIEKPSTIILFPGGHVEIARTTDNEYWVHVATRETEPGDPISAGTVIDCRVDAEGRYCNETNETLRNEIAKGDINHIAFLVKPPTQQGDQNG